MSQETCQKLVAMTGANQLTMNLQVNIAASTVIFRTEMDANTILQTAAKEKTTQFHETTQAVPKNERKSTMPPSLLVANSLIVEGTKIARAYSPETLVFQAFTE